MTNEYQEVSISNLRLGTKLRFPVLQRDQVLLLSEGTMVTERVLDLLERHGIHKVRVHANDLSVDRIDEEDESKPVEPRAKFYKTVQPPAAKPKRKQAMLLRSAVSRRLDETIQSRRELVRRIGRSRFFVTPHCFGSGDEYRAALQQRDERDAELITRCTDLHSAMIDHRRLDVNAIRPCFDEMADELARDPDLFCTIIRTPTDAQYPAPHCVNVGRLAMAVAAYLDWSREEIGAVGIGSWCHDVGMLRIPGRIYRTNAAMSTTDQQDLFKHPIFALDIVGLGSVVPESIPYITYQAHERCDGSGYPRGWTMRQIHPAARLVGMVDAYVAMISDRLHRTSILPHQAIQTVMRESQQGLWDPEMSRALMRAVSLYPLGSFVELWDGRIARAVQSNPERRFRPRMDVWTDPASIAFEPGELVDLSEETDLSIAHAIPAPQPI